MDVDGQTVNLEFARLHDAATAAVSYGQGNLSNPEYIDESIKSAERSEFLSRRTAKGLMKAIESGLPEMTTLVERLREQIDGDLATPISNRRRVRRNQEHGDEIDIDRYLNRIPEMWSRVDSESIPSKRVRITINGSVNCRQSQDELGYRAAAAIALADRLTEQGASVEIDLMISIANGPTDKARNVTASVIVKHSDHPMSIPDIATACCLIGAFRLSMVYGTVRYLEGRAISGLGTPASIPAKFRTADFIADTDITSRRAAIDWVRGSMNKFTENSEVA
jgi:hypothetical protein